MKSLEDLRWELGVNNLSAPPNRRYRLAKEYVRNDVRRAFRDDRPTRELFQFLRRLHLARHAAERRRIRAENWALAMALDLYRGKASELRPVVEAYLLSGLKSNLIAAKLGVSADVIRWFRDGFFDVRHLLRFPARVLHQVIRIVDESGRTSLDMFKVWKLVGYVLKAGVLDQLLGVVQTDRNPEGGAVAWLGSQTEAIAKLQYLLAVSAVDPLNAKQLAAVLKFGFLGQSKRSNQQDDPLSSIERHVQAMILDLPFCSGTDGKMVVKGTPIEPFDNSAVELRDRELLILGAGGEVDGLEGLTEFEMPAPTKRKLELDTSKSASVLDSIDPMKGNAANSSQSGSERKRPQ